MQAHELQSNNASAKRVGRGGKRGKTSGRGMKGQNARTGNSKRPEIRDFIKKFPKLRGQGINGNKSRDIITYFTPVNLRDIEAHFEKGAVVSPESLIKAGVIDYIDAKIPQVKILGDGEITKSVTIKNCATSASAKEAIEKAGGEVK